MKFTKQQQTEASEKLRKLLPVGSTVYTALASVSRSGMNRKIKVFAMVNGEAQNISFYVAALGIGSLAEKFGIRCVSVNGCGMDMGFHIVHNLGYALYPKGFCCIGDNCPSADHSNSYYLIGKCVECQKPLKVLSKKGKQVLSYSGYTPEHRKYNHEQVCEDHKGKPWNHNSGGYAFHHKWL